MAARSAQVSPLRLSGWLDRFTASHGAVNMSAHDGGLRLTAADGASAVLRLEEVYPHTAVTALLHRTVEQLAAARASGAEDSTGAAQATSTVHNNGSPPDPVAVFAELAVIAEVRARTGIILIRRGGYAVGVAEQERLLASKTGTRYVQSRTAAGGWSQQRFARRRASQAEALLSSAVAQAQRVIGQSAAGLLVFGGDRALCAEAARRTELAELARLPRLPFLDVPDPRLKVLEQAARTLNAIRFEVADG